MASGAINSRSLRINGFETNGEPGVFYAAAATFAGAGALTSYARLVLLAGATFTGAGALVTQTALFLAGRASFAGAGALTVTAGLALPIGATFAGGGALSCSAIAYFAGRAAFAGAGALASNSYVLRDGRAALAGAGALSAESYVLRDGRATLAGAGALSAESYVLRDGRATFAGVGTLVATTTLSLAARGTFAGVGSFIADTTQIGPLYGFANFTGAGALTTRTIQTHTLNEILAGSGSLFANGERQKFVDPTAFAGYSFVVARSQLVFPILASYNGTGALNVAGIRVPPNAAINGPRRVINGVGINQRWAQVVYLTRASFAGVGSFYADADVMIATNPAVFAGEGFLYAILQQPFHNANAYLPGVSDLEAHAGVWRILQGTAALGGVGTLYARATKEIENASAVFAGTGALATNATVLLLKGADFVGAGNLYANAVIRTASLGAINSNKLVINGFGINGLWRKVNWGLVYVFAGSGALSATTTCILAGYKAMAGTGALVAHANIAATAETWLRGEGTLFVAPQPQGYAALTGQGALTAYATLRAYSYQIQFRGIGFLDALSAAKAVFGGMGMLHVETQLDEKFFDHPIQGVVVAAHPGGVVVGFHPGGSAANDHLGDAVVVPREIGTEVDGHPGGGGLAPHPEGEDASEHSGSGTTIDHPTGVSIMRHAA